MQIYWDLSEKERAALTETDVERFVAAELMTKGVLRAKPFELEPEPALPAWDVEVFVVKTGHFNKLDLGFKTRDAARAALADAVVISSTYINGTSVPMVEPLKDVTIATERFHSQATVDAARAAFEKTGAIRSENERRKRAHEEQTRKERDALAGLWSDWHVCRAKAVEMDRVLETLEDYKRIAGDDEVARQFLHKAFAWETLVAADEWFGLVLTAPFAAPGEAAAE